jgi:hypothetical protein
MWRWKCESRQLCPLKAHEIRRWGQKEHACFENSRRSPSRPGILSRFGEQRKIGFLRRNAKKSGRDDRPLGQRRGLLALFVFEFREPLEDERVRPIGQLGHQRQVIATEAIGIVVLVIIIHIGPGECDAVEFLLGLILPHGGFNAAKAEGLHRKVRGGGVLSLEAVEYIC